MFIREIISEGDVTQLKPQTSGTKKPTFSKENAQKAFEEWLNGAAVDTDIEIVGNDNQLYYIRQNTDGDSQHFKDDHWYLTDANNNIEDNEGYPDPGDLLFSHSATGYEPIHPDDLDENFADGKPGSSITLYNVKGEKKVFTVDKVSPTGSMMVSGNGLNRIIVGNTPNAVTFNVRDPNYKIRAPGFQMQGKAVRDISPADLDNAIMQIKNTIKTFPKNQLGYNDLLADYFALKFKKDSDTVNSMQHENFADGKKKGKSRPGRVKRSGASCKGSVTSLRAKAKKYSGERAKMYHWCANMKSGKKKTNEDIDNLTPSAKLAGEYIDTDVKSGKIKNLDDLKRYIVELRLSRIIDHAEDARALWIHHLTVNPHKLPDAVKEEFKNLKLPTWMSHTSLEKLFTKEYGARYGEYVAYMDLDSDDDLAMNASGMGDMAFEMVKANDIKVMQKFLAQMPVQFTVDDLRLDDGIQVWHLVQQNKTVH